MKCRLITEIREFTIIDQLSRYCEHLNQSYGSPYGVLNIRNLSIIKEGLYEFDCDFVGKRGRTTGRTQITKEELFGKWK